MRGATPEKCCKPEHVPSFQSTRPMRGATSLRLPSVQSHRVSIHAPHAGRDGYVSELAFTLFVSIHAPHAGRDIVRNMIIEWLDKVSIHAPHAGRDLIYMERMFPMIVSIHAPHAGRDDVLDLLPAVGVFQSTRPMRGATAKEVTTSLLCHVFMGIPLHKYDFLGT